MTFRDFMGLPFENIGNIVPERDASGGLQKFMPQARFRGAATTKLHAYGAGPFCRFRIAFNRHDAGVYVLTLNDTAVYVGDLTPPERVVAQVEGWILGVPGLIRSGQERHDPASAACNPIMSSLH